MSENNNYFEKSKKLVKRYERDRLHYFKLEEFIAITDYYAAGNKYKNALEASKTAEVFYPSSFELKVIQADLYIKDNEVEKAEKIIKSIEYSSDVAADVCVLKGEVCIKKNQLNAAVKFFDKAIQLSDDREYLIEMICSSLITLHQLQLAKKYLEFANETIDDINPDLLYWLAKCYEQESRYGKAANIYEKLAEMAPLDEMIWDELGNIYMMVPDYENAIRAFDLRLSISKQNAEDTLLNKAECLSITGKNGEALKIYNTILETDKENADAAFGIAKCYEREGMCNIAEKLYLDIIRENSDYTDAYYCLANIYAQQNNFEAAERFMLKVLDNAEVTPAFLIQMTEILLQQNKLAEAKKIMEKVITKPSYKHDYIAWLLYSEIIAEYDVVKAIEILEEKYNESFYSIAEVCYHLAYYHFSNNNITQCIVYFERGLELNDKLIKPFFDLCPEVKLNTQIMNVYLSFMAKHL